jgi:hypothetical protein
VPPTVVFWQESQKTVFGQEKRSRHKRVEEDSFAFSQKAALCFFVLK